MKDFGLNKNVVVEVRGTQYVGDISDSMEIVTPGTYNYKNEVAYVLYDEYNEESKQPVKNMLKISDNKVELVKRGEYNVNMIFGLNEESLSYYNTPFGQILIGIATDSMNIDLLDDRFVVNIKYRLMMNGEHASDNEIHIVVKN